MATGRFDHLNQASARKPRPSATQGAAKKNTAATRHAGKRPQQRFAHLSSPRAAEGLKRFQDRQIATSWDHALRQAAGEASTSDPIARGWDAAFAKVIPQHQRAPKR